MQIGIVLILEEGLREATVRLCGVDQIAACGKSATTCRERHGRATDFDLPALENAQREVHRGVARGLRGNHERRWPVPAAHRALALHRVPLHRAVAREPERAIVSRLRDQRPRCRHLVLHDVADRPRSTLPPREEVDAGDLGIDVVSGAQ